MVQAVKACAAKGVWVTVVVPSIVPDEGLNEALQGIFGVDVIELPYRAAGRHKLRTYAVLFYNLRAAMYLLKYVRDKHVSTIYSSSSITFLGGLVADTAEIRHVWHWHEPVDKRFGWHPSMKGSTVLWYSEPPTLYASPVSSSRNGNRPCKWHCLMSRLFTTRSSA